MVKVFVQKQTLRSFLLKKRGEMVGKDVDERSAKITKNLLNLAQITKKDTFLAYLPINNEVKTEKIIEKLQRGGKIIFLPCYFNDSDEYGVSEFRAQDKLEQGPYGILQPFHQKMINSEIIEIALIPGLAFSKKGI